MADSYFFSMPTVTPASRQVAQQKTDSLPRALQVCRTPSFKLNPVLVFLMVDLQPGQ
ncbi:MAG: hypothetical protein KF791_09760 [Verrucomicrobiae bacterium]|nr:hypothetical protein [Verrucomicrobiae bacterium]